MYSSRSSSEESSAAPLGSGGSSSVNPLTEDRVAQLIATQMASLSESFATSMEVFFANIQSLIDDRLASYSNHSFSAPSPVPVQSSPSQGQQNLSISCPHTGYNPGGRVEELVLAESATSFFLASIRTAGIAIPEGFIIIIIIIIIITFQTANPNWES